MIPQKCQQRIVCITEGTQKTKLFKPNKTIKIKNADFVAEIYHITDKTRFKSSLFMGTIIDGEICKDDIVQFLDEDMKFIVEEKVCTICNSPISADIIRKDDTKDNHITFEFYNIYDFPITTTNQ